MRNYKLVYLLVGIMFAIVTVVAGTSIYLLYRAAFETERRRLVDAVQHSTRLIEGMVTVSKQVRGDAASGTVPDRDALVARVVEQYRRFNFQGFGETGNFMVAERRGDHIVTLLHHRNEAMPGPPPVRWQAVNAEPMRQALLGQTGSLVGADFAGNAVLAAFAPVPPLGLGIVAKIRVAEVRAPFVRAGLVAGAAALLLGVFGAVLFFRVTHPFVRRLEESEARSRQVIDTAADAIVTVNDAGLIVSINPAAEQMFGYAAAELTGQTVERILPGSFQPSPADPQGGRPALVFHALQRTAMVELTGTTRTGASLPVEVSFREATIQGRQLFTGVCRDISLRKEAEAQIVRAKEDAERSNQAKTEFMALISHELRTPMNGVLGMNSLLLSTALSAEQKRYADAVRTSGETLLNIINDILDYSKIETGMLELDQVDFELAPIVENVIELLQAQAGSKYVEMGAYIDPAVPHVVRGDPGRLKQVLFNLVGNAVKFTDTGAVTVELSLAGSGDTGAVVRCEVTDTGIGISREIGGRLFDRFTQGDASTARRYGGTGLGLAIAKELTALMGGEIGYESEPAQGSRFWFTVTFPPAEGPRATPAEPAPVLAGRRVLAVCGVQLYRGLLRKQLEALGMRVTEAPSGAVALEEFGRTLREGAPYELVLANRSLPDMEGDDLLRGLRRMKGAAGTRTLLLAGVGERDTRRGASDKTAPVQVSKPVHQSMLGQTLASLFEAATPAAKSTRKRRRSRTPAASPLHILLAEDNPVNQLLTAAYLKKMGHRVDVVGDGREAVRAVNRNIYDLVLMDVQMPGIDGLEAAAAIRGRKTAPRRQVPIIAITADVMRGDRERFIAAGMNDHIAKPFDFASLSEVVERWSGQQMHSLADTTPGPDTGAD